MLVELENKFGDAVSLDDILGIDDGSGGGRRASVAEEEAAMGMTLLEAHEEQKHAHKKRFKAPTDQKNAAFAKAKRNKVEKDFLGEQKIWTKQTVKATRKKLRDQAKQGEEEGLQLEAQYVYSGQKLQYTEARKRQMRETLAKDKGATYTYSNDFQSLAVEMVDEDKVRRDEAAESQARWKTQRGFIYPAPRPASEFNKHPKAPSGPRREELAQPWVENENNKPPMSRDDKKFDP